MNSGLVRSIADLSSRWRSHFWPSKESSDQPAHIRRGASGENEACRFLRRNGYKILYRNFRGRTGGEIDIVCRDRDTLVFVEVKTRGSEEFGRPVEAVAPDQQRRISRGALAWLRMLDNPDIVFRFDVVEVISIDGAKPQLELVRNAFELSKPYMY
jgi:putative endonuclease